MGKLRLLVGIIISVTAVTVAWANLASAHSFRAGNNVTVGQEQAVQQSLFMSGRTIDISSEVFGDIFCAGQNITISGKVHGDIICAGQSINIRGTVDGDLRLAGQNITIGAAVTGSATVVSQTFTLDSTGSIEGDVSLGATDATINGTVGRDIAAGTETLIISGEVGRNITATVTTLRLESDATIAGTIDYTSKNELDRSNDAKVGGEITRSEPTESTSSKQGAVFGFSIWWFVYWFFAMLVTALVLVLLFPRIFQTTTNRDLPWPWKSLLAGLVASLVVPVLFVVLAITFVGLPLAFLLALLWLVVLILSGPFFAYYLGQLLLRQARHPLLVMLVGAVTLLVLYFIPIVGIIVLLLALWTGSGMILREAFRRTPRPAYTTAAIDSPRPQPVAIAKPTPKRTSRSTKNTRR